MRRRALPVEILLFKKRLRARSLEVFGPRGAQAAVARATQSASGTVVEWFSLRSKTMPGGDKMLLLPDVLHCSGDWLLTGRGNPDRVRGDDYQLALHAAADRISQLAAQLRNGGSHAGR